MRLGVSQLRKWQPSRTIAVKSSRRYNFIFFNYESTRLQRFYLKILVASHTLSLWISFLEDPVAILVAILYARYYVSSAVILLGRPFGQLNALFWISFACLGVVSVNGLRLILGPRVKPL